MSSNIKIDSSLPADTVWFITGCSSGIGKSLVLEILNNTSHSVIATARNTSSLAYIPKSGRVLTLPLDVTSVSSISTALSSGLSTFKHIDVLVNNAGYGILGDTETIPDDAARKVLETNFWGPVNLTKEAVRIFREVNGPKGGIIVQVSTMGGVVAFAGESFYHASKFALEGFTESLSHEIPPSWNIQFLIIEPGGVKTNFAGSSLARFPPSPAYSDPSYATRQLEAFFETPKLHENMSDADKVASIMLEAVALKKKGELGLRLPVGVDAWTYIKGKHVREVEEVEKVKELSWKTGNEAILKDIGFL
ncbi:Short-chain dehydrogenase protein [Rutstroemia sp. NJR-2017a BBW]|nr:Short-chain dehydrogenase protein [Rutstroemia sp. NJR-2017a BBW]